MYKLKKKGKKALRAHCAVEGLVFCLRIQVN